ncbi:MAG: RnfABCDGE type electron transport complex subunit D, partial [Pseudomonadota bacterium]
MSEKLSVSFSPHLQDRRSICSMNFMTILALAPAFLFGFYYYGLRAVVIVALSMVTAMVVESIIEMIMKKPLTYKTGSAALTGLLLAMLLPVGVPWWLVMIGAAVAVLLGRQLFGGLGGNPFNAVLVGWVVLRLSWPTLMSTFHEATPLLGGWGDLSEIDGSELPLSLLKMGDSGGALDIYELKNVLWGNIPGGIGSTSVIGLAIGGLFLVIRRIVPWQVPAGFLGGFLVFALIFWLTDEAGELYANPLYHLIFGYTLIGAFFLATDPTTSPYSSLGGLIFGIVAGVVTLVIRYWGAYPDGVTFAILFMNTLTPT